MTKSKTVDGKGALEPLREWFREHRITEVECLVADLTGEAKGKIVPANRYINGEAPRLPDSVFGKTVTGDYPDDMDEMFSPTDRDMQMVPDAGTCRLVPWAQDATAQIIHTCRYMDGTEVDVNPRYVLRRVVDKFSELGLTPIVAPEMEFYLVKPNIDADYPLEPPAGRTGRADTSRRAYSIDAANEFDPIFEDVYDYCEAQDLDVDTLIHEEGSGQMEVNFRHAESVDLADQVFYFKRTLRVAALKHGIVGPFMAKPMAGEPGSAMHVHQSLLDVRSGANVFAGNDGPSDVFRHYVAGLQKYLPLGLALIAPNVNSYRRLFPHAASETAAPVNTEWGRDNRTVGLRMPYSGPADTRIENRLAGADANPYIAIALSLACGYLGLQEKLEPRPEVKGSGYERDHNLPSDFGRALDALEGCAPLRELLGDRFIRTYLAVKRAELSAHFSVISSWEREYLLLRV